MPDYTRPPFTSIVCHMDEATRALLTEQAHMTTEPAPVRQDGVQACLVSIPAECIIYSITPYDHLTIIKLHSGHAVSFGHRDINAVPSYTEAWISFAPGMAHPLIVPEYLRR